jgi:hypothetical protein
MSCGLSQDELDVIQYLVRSRCLSEKHSISIRAMERDLLELIPELQDIVKDLVLKGYLGCKKKDRVNYWAVAGPSLRVLAWHDIGIWRGGRGGL